MCSTTVRALELGVLAVSARSVFRVVKLALHLVTTVVSSSVRVGTADATVHGLITNASSMVKTTAAVTSAQTRDVLKVPNRASLAKYADGMFNCMVSICLTEECKNDRAPALL